MFKVKIGMKEVGESESLTEACRMFIERMEELVREGAAEWVIREASWIQTEINGLACMMNFNAIMDFSLAVGILKEDLSLTGEPIPKIPQDLERVIFLAAFENSLNAFLLRKKVKIFNP